MIERYVKLPVEVRATQFDGTVRCGNEIARWLESIPAARAYVVKTGANGLDVVGAIRAAEKASGQTLHRPAVIIETPFALWVAERSDWVVLDEHNLVSTIDPDVFDEDYAPYEGCPPVHGDVCRDVELPSDEVIRVRGVEPLSPEGREALGEVVGMVRQRMAGEPPTRRMRPGDQQLPKTNELPVIQDLVIGDIEERRRLGIERYGTALQPYNGRDTLRDLYEELLDAAMYTRQALFERDNPAEG